MYKRQVVDVDLHRYSRLHPLDADIRADECEGYASLAESYILGMEISLLGAAICIDLHVFAAIGLVF